MYRVICTSIIQPAHRQCKNDVKKNIKDRNQIAHHNSLPEVDGENNIHVHSIFRFFIFVCGIGSDKDYQVKLSST